MATKPSIVFAHGLWADGSCFSKLIPTLQAEGHEVIAAQNSLDSLKGDVDAVIRALGRVSSPAVLVGHSYGGTVITAAGTDERVAGLVYICALAPDADETSQSQQDKFPRTDVFGHIEVADDRVWLKPSGIACFAGDLPEQEQKLVWATQGVPDADLFNQKLEGTAWRSKPSCPTTFRSDVVSTIPCWRSICRSLTSKAVGAASLIRSGFAKTIEKHHESTHYSRRNETRGHLHVFRNFYDRSPNGLRRNAVRWPRRFRTAARS